MLCSTTRPSLSDRALRVKFPYESHQPTTQCYKNEIDNKYTMEILGRNFRPPSSNGTEDLFIICLDTLTIES